MQKFIRLSASVSPEIAERIRNKAEANGKTTHAYVSELVMKYWDKDEFATIVDENSRLSSQVEDLREQINELDDQETLHLLKMKATLYDKMMLEYQNDRKGFFARLFTKSPKKLQSDLISKYLNK